jgi:glucose-1-phosphate thymidylyltransferase
MLAGIKEILLISTPRDLPQFQNLLQDGKQWGIHISYVEQAKPNGLAEAFILGEKFIDNEPCALILGDNIFYGHDFVDHLKNGVKHQSGATVFAYAVNDPERYGVIEFDENMQALSLQEKPKNPRSRYAVTGLYFYDKQVVELAKSVRPSARGELEITDLNRLYLEKNQLQVEVLGRGLAWLDTGTHESLLDAAHYIHTLEKRQGVKIACPEEVAWRLGWISDDQLVALAHDLEKSGYGAYLLELLKIGDKRWR